MSIKPWARPILELHFDYCVSEVTHHGLPHLSQRHTFLLFYLLLFALFKPGIDVVEGCEDHGVEADRADSLGDLSVDRFELASGTGLRVIVICKDAMELVR